MRKLLMLVVCAVVVFPLAGIGGEKKRFEGEVSEWVSGMPNVPARLFPIGGAGQVNGGFVVAERNGVQIGIRAQERLVGPLPSTRQKNVGVYVAEVGSEGGLATWNYDIHVDFRGAFGVAKGKTLDDYTLTFDTDIAESLFTFDVPLDIGEDFFPLVDGVRLFQTSQNPTFGNDTFDPTVPGTYHFALTLTPKTFNGSPIVATMAVVVE